jgi:mannosyltransferase
LSARATRIFWALAIVALALAGLHRSLRADDIWSLHTASQTLPVLWRTVQADVHPPLYFLLLHPWVSLFGDSELALRSLSILFHLLAVWAVAWLARRVAPPAVALLCAVVYATAPLALLSAELVRMYSLAALLAALSAALWLDLARAPGSLWRWSAWLAVNVAGTFTHLWFFCLLGGLGVATLIHFRLRAVKIIAGLAAALVPFALLWLPALLGQLARSREAAAWLQPPDTTTLRDMLLLQGGWSLLLVPVLAVAAWRGRKAETPIPVWALTAWVAALLPPLLISWWRPFFHPRFTIVALPLLAVAMGCWGSRLRPRLVAAGLLSCAAIFGLAGARTGAVCDARTAAHYLAARAGPGDTVVFTSLSRSAADYYLDRLAPTRRWHESTFPAEIDTHPGYEGDLANPARRASLEAEAHRFASQAVPRVFLLHGYRPAVDHPLFSRLRARFRQSPDSLQCPGRGDYYVCIDVFVAPRANPALH